MQGGSVDQELAVAIGYIVLGPPLVFPTPVSVEMVSVQIG